MAFPSPSGPERRRDHLHVVDERHEIAVLLLCASDDVEPVEHAVRGLGDATHVVGGLELGGELLRRAVQQAQRRTLFVVCKTDALDPMTVRRAVEGFGARRAAGHRLLVVELVPHRSAGFIGTVRRARDQLGRARDAGLAPPIGMRDSSTAEAVEGETHVDHALGRMELTTSVERERKTRVRDHVGTIPPHVRVPGRPPRPELAVVDVDRDTIDDCATESDAELVGLDPRAPAANTAPPVRRVRFDRRTIRLTIAAIAALASAAVIVLGQ